MKRAAGSSSDVAAHKLTRRGFLLAGTGLLVLGAGGRGQSARAARDDLDVFGDYPRAFFFRQSEVDAASGQLPYGRWERRYLPLGGIVGKVLNEEHGYSSENNLAWFLRYKKRNPSKMVLLHYNGTGRRAPDEATTRFFSGHWLYYRGTALTEAIAASPSASVVNLADTSAVSLGRYSARDEAIKDDLVVARVGGDGRPVWTEAEHMRLQAVDAENGTISVERGAYGTQPLSFPAGSYLAAHVMTGPFSSPDGLMQGDVPLWSYNFSTSCPTDARGRTCGDALAEYLGEKLGPGGELSSLDGLTLDVYTFTLKGFPAKDVDVNVDGRGDGGIVAGVDTFSLGSLGFLENLRDRLPGKILLSDGQFPTKSQRGFGHLNGLESEGYPDLYDFELAHLSRGENVLDFWAQNSAGPSLNYINFKYKEIETLRSRNTFVEPNLSEDRSYEKMRLALASALFTDTAFAYGFGVEWMPPGTIWEESGTNVRVFDELWKGTAQEPNWLGQPLGPAVHLAERTPDLLDGRGESWPPAFVDRFEGEDVSFSREGTQAAPIMTVRYVGSHGSPVALRRTWTFVLPGLEVTGKDLFVSLRARAEPLEGYPASVPRRLDVYAIPSGGVLDPANKEFTWVGADPFAASLYFQDVGPGTVELTFVVEGGRPVHFEGLAAHSARDGRYREYENGVVFANPSVRPYTFNLRRLFPRAALRRIQGSANQAPDFNDGTLLGDQLTLSPKNALFAVRRET